MGFPAEGLAFKILQPGIYSFSRHIRFFSYGCVLSGIFGVFPMYLRAFHLPAIGHAEGKISVLLCVYKETGETTGRINKSS